MLTRLFSVIQTDWTDSRLVLRSCLRSHLLTRFTYRPINHPPMLYRLRGLFRDIDAVDAIEVSLPRVIGELATQKGHRSSCLIFRVDVQTCVPEIPVHEPSMR
jgi:hypothetical protein